MVRFFYVCGWQSGLIFVNFRWAIFDGSHTTPQPPPTFFPLSSYNPLVSRPASPQPAQSARRGLSRAVGAPSSPPCAAPSRLCQPFACQPFACQPFACQPFACQPFACQPFAAAACGIHALAPLALVCLGDCFRGGRQRGRFCLFAWHRKSRSRFSLARNANKVRFALAGSTNKYYLCSDY